MTRPGTGFDSRACGTPPFLSSNAGSRRAYRGRPARQHAQSARDTPGQHSHGSRDRCPVCAPGLWANTSFYVFFFWRSGKTGPSARVNAVAMRKSATHDIPDRREYAGVVQWQNTILPSWERGSDSRHRLQGVSPEYLPFMFGSPEQTGRDGQHGPPASTGGSICDSLERHWPQPGGIPGTLKKKGWTIWQKQNGLGQTVPGRSSRHGDSAGRTSPTRTGC